MACVASTILLRRKRQSQRTERSLKGKRRSGHKAYWLFAMAHDLATNKGTKRNLFPGGLRNLVIQK